MPPLVHKMCDPPGDADVPYIEPMFSETKPERTRRLDRFFAQIIQSERSLEEQHKERVTDALRHAFQEDDMTLDEALPFRVFELWRATRFFCEAVGLISHGQLLSENPEINITEPRPFGWYLSLSSYPPTSTHTTFLNQFRMHASKNPQELFSLSPRPLNNGSLLAHRAMFTSIGTSLKLSQHKGKPSGPLARKLSRVPIGRWGCAGTLMPVHGSYTQEEQDDIYKELWPSLSDFLDFEYGTITEVSDILTSAGMYGAMDYLRNEVGIMHSEASGLCDMAARGIHATRLQDPELVKSLHVARLQNLQTRCRNVQDRRVELAAMRAEAEIVGLTNQKDNQSQDELLEAALLGAERAREQLTE